MYPLVANGRVNPLLTNVLLAYTNQEYFADRILPTVPGLKEYKGKIPQLGNSHLRIYSSKRSIYDTSDHRVDYTINQDNSYEIEYYDLEAYTPYRLQQQLQAPFDARKMATMTVMEALMLEREYALAQQMTSATVLTNNTTLSGTSQYTDTVNSTPQSDFDTARTSVFDSIGREANTVLMNRKVANALRRHPFFAERAISRFGGNVVGATGALSMSAFIETMKAEFDVTDVIVAKSIYVNTKEGQTETKTQVWGNDVVFFYRPATPSLFTPSFGYSFQLEGYNRAVYSRKEKNIGMIDEVFWGYQDNILDTDAAYLIKDAVS